MIKAVVSKQQACRPWVCLVCHGTPNFWQISYPFQPRGTDYAHLITTGTPRFSDLPTVLNIAVKNRLGPVPRSLYVPEFLLQSQHNIHTFVVNLLSGLRGDFQAKLGIHFRPGCSNVTQLMLVLQYTYELLTTYLNEFQIPISDFLNHSQNSTGQLNNS